MGREKKILKVMGVFSGVQAVSIVCSVVRAKLIAIWIGPAGVGIFAVLNSALDMISSSTQLNLRQTAVRDISAAAPGRLQKAVAAVRWWSSRLGLVGAAAMAGASPLLSIASFGHAGMWWAFAALAIAAYAMALTSGEQAIMQGTGHLADIAKSTLRGVVCGTAVSAPLFYFLGEGSIAPTIVIFALCHCLATLARRQPPVPAMRPRENWEQGKGFLRLGAAFTVSSLATSLANYAFLSYLTQKGGEDATGCYQAGYTMVVRYIGLVFAALAMEYYPRLVRSAHRPLATSRIVSHETSLLLCVLTPIAVAFVSVDKFLLNLLYSSEFDSALPLMTIGIGSAVFRVVSYCQSYVMLARGDGRAFIFTESASAAVGLGLNIAGYNLWGMAGLGASYVAWYAAYVALVGIVYHGKYKMRLSRGAAGLAVASAITIGGAIALKSIGWAAPLAMLIPALAMPLMAKRTRKRNHL